VHASGIHVVGISADCWNLGFSAGRAMQRPIGDGD